MGNGHHKEIRQRCLGISAEPLPCAHFSPLASAKYILLQKRGVSYHHTAELCASRYFYCVRILQMESPCVVSLCARRDSCRSSPSMEGTRLCFSPPILYCVGLEALQAFFDTHPAQGSPAPCRTVSWLDCGKVPTWETQKNCSSSST